MNFKKYIAAGAALSALLTSIGCVQQDAPPEESSEPVVINTGIDPKSVVFDWQAIYENKLNDYKKKSENYSDASRFDIYDINNDGIPELIISPNADAKTVCEVYTYVDGLEKVTDIGAYGEFRYIPFLDCYGYEYIGDGFTYGQYGKIVAGVYQNAVTYYNNAASASSGAVIRYEINNEETTLVDYENKLKSYREGVGIDVGRKYTFGKESIDYAIHNAESWGAVLSDVQKSAYSGLLRDILKNSPENDAAFELCDLDGNNIPELVLSTGIAADSDCRVYYLNEAAIADLGSGCGKNGFFCYDMKQNVFFSDDAGKIQCWSLTTSDLSKYKKSDSYMECGRKYLLTAEAISAAFV